MSRTNVILLGVLAAVVAIWLAGKDWDEGKSAGPASRFFPDFNKEAADEIVIEGGWQKTRYALARQGSEWKLVSAGGYDVKTETANRFLDAVYNLRRENELGSSADLQQRTHTDKEKGRLVKVSHDGTPIAEFYLGKNPKGAYEEYFVRAAGHETVYRDRTILSKDRDKGVDEVGGGPRGFDWHNHVNNASTKWIDTKIWNLGNAEATELWLTRKGELDVKMIKQADDKWELADGGQPPVPGDADAIDSIVSQIRSLSLYDVVGSVSNDSKEFGLDEPEITLVMTLRKQVEKKAEQKPGGDGEKKEEEKKEEEYITINRILEVGKKVERPDYDSYSDEFKTNEYYAIRIGPRKGFDDAGEERRTNFIFLVNSYAVGPLKKTAEDLKAVPPPEEEKEDGDAPKKDDAEPKTDDAEPKKDDPEAPEKNEGDEPKKDDPETPPKKDDPETPPKKDDPVEPPKKKEDG